MTLTRRTPEDMATVTIGDGVATISRRGRTEAIVARILGTERDPQSGTETVWLDRLVHYLKETQMQEWTCSGAITTILQRPLPPA